MDKSKIMDLVNDRNVIGLGKSVLAAEGAIVNLKEFHSKAEYSPAIVLWKEEEKKKKKEKAVHTDGALAWAERVFFEAKLLLSVATTLKVIHVRVHEKDKEGKLVFASKDKKEAIKRIKNMIKSPTVAVDKEFPEALMTQLRDI